MKSILFLAGLMTVFVVACQSAAPVQPAAVAPTRAPTSVPVAATPTSGQPTQQPSKPTAAKPTPKPLPALELKNYAVSCNKDCTWKIEGVPDVFLGPGDVAVDRQGNIIVADRGRNAVLKFDQEGKLLAKWGSYGSGDSQFASYMILAVDKDNNIYVSDTGNNRVQKFDANGKLLMKFATTGMTGDKSLGPLGIAVDEQGNIYVGGMADIGVTAVKEALKKFDRTGKFLGMWGNVSELFQGVWDITIDKQGNVYVADFLNNRVVKLDQQGKQIATMNSCAPIGQAKENMGPTSMEVDEQGNVHVLDFESHRLCVFGPDGRFLSTWTKREPGAVDFVNLWGMAMDQQGNMVFVDGTGDLNSPGHIWKISKQ